MNIHELQNAVRDKAREINDVRHETFKFVSSGD